MNKQDESARILVVDDDVSIMRCVGAYLEKQENIDVLGYSEHAQIGLVMALSEVPDLVLMDVHMPGMDAFWACREIVDKTEEQVQVLFYTGFPRDQYLDRCIAAGASGMVSKHTESIHNLGLAIHYVLNGHSYFSPELAKRLVELESGEPKSRLSTLSHREMEILSHLAKGETNNEIAKQLDISLRLVVKCVTEMRKKLELSSTNELLIFSANEGLVFPELLYGAPD